MLHYRIIVIGDVQGVGFRYFVLKNASLYGINGWVRNKQDGSVEIDAEGKDINIKEFMKIIEMGNSFSIVISVEVDNIKTLANYKAFEIIDDE